MSEASLWALLPDTAEDILLSLAREKDLAEKPVNPQAFSYLPDGGYEAPPYSLENGVAIIDVSGPIDRRARISFWSGLPYTAGQDAIRDAIEAALSDRAVGAILLSIDSPGGIVAGTKELADFIADIRGQKPIAAYADGLCASAAFWLAAATGEIFAPKTAQVGSIGVIAVLTDWTRAADKAGITRTVIHSGKWKAAGSPDKSLTDEERAHFQARLDALHQIFTADVAARLNLSIPGSSKTGWAEGQTFLGTEALALGLVSKIVQDRAEAVSALAAKIQNGEKFMNLQELKASHPELVTELAAELAAGSEAAQKDAVSKAQKETLELVAALGGADLVEKAQTLLAAGITGAQMKVLAPMLARPEARNSAPDEDKPSAEEKARAEALEAIKSATGAPVPAAGNQQKVCALLADAERRAARSN